MLYYLCIDYKGTGKRGHIVAETLLLMTFPCARKLGNICCGHKMFLNKIRNIFVSRTQNLCAQQMLRARANGETFVSATMCPRLPIPLQTITTGNDVPQVSQRHNPKSYALDRLTLRPFTIRVKLNIVKNFFTIPEVRVKYRKDLLYATLQNK